MAIIKRLPLHLLICLLGVRLLLETEIQVNEEFIAADMGLSRKGERWFKHALFKDVPWTKSKGSASCYKYFGHSQSSEHQRQVMRLPCDCKHNQTSASEKSAAATSDNKEWIIGSLLIVGATLAWSALFILQAAVLKKYSAQLSVATLICFLGTLQAAILSIAVVCDTSQWALGWDINLIATVYFGVVTSAIAYYVQGLCIRLKGIVFATTFSPLMMIIVAVMGSIILSENIFLGSVLGGVMIAIGLYVVMWEKSKDSMISTDKICSEVISNFTYQNKVNDIKSASNHPMREGDEAHQDNAAARGGRRLRREEGACGPRRPRGLRREQGRRRRSAAAGGTRRRHH